MPASRLQRWLRVEYEAVARAASHGRELSGVYVLPAADSRAWHGLLCLHASFYKGALFRFRVEFPAAYPDEPPSVRFAPRVHHPLVGPDGDLQLGDGLAPWERERLCEHGTAPAVALLRYVKRIFFQNELLAEVDMERVRASVAQSQAAIYDDAEAGSRLRLRLMEPQAASQLLHDLTVPRPPQGRQRNVSPGGGRAAD